MKLTVIVNDSCGCCKKYLPKISAICADRDIMYFEEDVNDTRFDLDTLGMKGLPFTVIEVDDKVVHCFTGDLIEKRIIETLDALHG